MSDHEQIVVRIDPLPPSRCHDLASKIQHWLRASGIVQLNEKPAYHGWTRWAPGPRWIDAVTDVNEAPFLELQHTGVEIAAERKVQSGPGDMPNCEHCSTPLDDSRFGELIEAWLDDGEPTPDCPACGWSALLGDWPSDWPSAYVGAPAITFNNWFRLRPEFSDELYHLLGGRCRTLAFKL